MELEKQLSLKRGTSGPSAKTAPKKKQILMLMTTQDKDKEQAN